MNLFGLELSDADTWLLAGVSSCLGGLIHHWLAIYRNNRSNALSAAIKFREAFLPELSALESKASTSENTRDLLIASFDRHQMAVASYKDYLAGRKQSAFLRAWNAYHFGQSFDPVKFGLDGKNQVLLQYVAVSDEEELAAKRLAIRNIHGLLTFAKRS